MPATHTHAQAVTEQNPKLLWLTCSNPRISPWSHVRFLPYWLQCLFTPPPLWFSLPLSMKPWSQRSVSLASPSQSHLRGLSWPPPTPTSKSVSLSLHVVFFESVLYRVKHSINYLLNELRVLKGYGQGEFKKTRLLSFFSSSCDFDPHLERQDQQLAFFLLRNHYWLGYQDLTPNPS